MRDTSGLIPSGERPCRALARTVHVGARRETRGSARRRLRTPVGRERRDAFMRWGNRLLLPAVLAAAALGPVTSAGAAGGQNGLDCNGFGAGSGTVNPANYMCTDLHAGIDEPAEDNGHYVGHDEPLVGYYSTEPGSGYNVRYQVTLPVEPPALPTGSRHGPIDT